MCAVSALQAYMGDRTQITQWTRPMLNEYQEILTRLEALDAKLEQPDCVDPAKEAWMRDVERRLKDIEKGEKFKGE